MTLSVSPDPGEALVAAVRQGIQAEADRLAEVMIRAAIAQFETDLREAVGRRLVNAHQFYDIERAAGRLIVTVRLQEAGDAA